MCQLRILLYRSRMVCCLIKTVKHGIQAFWWCESLQTVVIPDSVTTIELSAFEYCTALTTATIPASVKEIGVGAFSGCPNLTLQVVPGSVGETYAISENIPYEYIQ